DDLLRSLGKDRARLDLGVRAAATKSIPGLTRSLGYLYLTEDRIIFVSRRMLRARTWRADLREIKSASWSPGIFLDKFNLTTPDGDVRFDILKPLRRSATSPEAANAATASSR